MSFSEKPSRLVEYVFILRQKNLSKKIKNNIEKKADLYNTKQLVPKKLNSINIQVHISKIAQEE